MCHLIFPSHPLRSVFLLFISQMRSLRPRDVTLRGWGRVTSAWPPQGDVRSTFPLPLWREGQAVGVGDGLSPSPTPTPAGSLRPRQAGSLGIPRLLEGNGGMEKMGGGGVGETLRDGNESDLEKKERGKKSRN